MADPDQDGCSIAGGRGFVKSTLMNQKIIAGLGNVWTDEILFQARIHPKKAVRDLGAAGERKLFRTMRRVLEEAIEFKVEPEDAPEGYLLNRREPGAPCPHRCSGRVARIAVGGRAGYLCERCQS